MEDGNMQEIIHAEVQIYHSYKSSGFPNHSLTICQCIFEYNKSKKFMRLR